MANNAEMTPEELNRAIGEAKGFQHLKLANGEDGWFIPDADNTENYQRFTQVSTPAWTTDPADALELLAEMRIDGYGLFPRGNTSWWVDSPIKRQTLSLAKDPAEAIARAWWAWKAAQDE